jgi:hypothetical protein
MLIVWFVVLIVFSVLCGKLSEVPDSSKVSITSHIYLSFRPFLERSASCG